MLTKFTTPFSGTHRTTQPLYCRPPYGKQLLLDRRLILATRVYDREAVLRRLPIAYSSNEYSRY